MATNDPGRRLIWVPIIHSQEDMGRLRESVREHHEGRLGAQHWDDHVKAVAAFWARIREAVRGLGLDLRRVRIYQDGLPVCGHEAAIIADLAAAGSENHRLLAEMIAGGAAVEGTEAPALLLEEYELALKLLNGKGVPVAPEVAREMERHGRELLQRRDRFVARRIDETLRPGETGVVFLGMLHSLGPFLPADIRLERLEVQGALRT